MIKTISERSSDKILKQAKVMKILIKNMSI